MAVADECFSRGAGGQPGLIVCLGEAGAGKTRLAREALEAAVDRGFLVAWGTADDTTGTPPHWPWQQVLRSLAASADLVGMADGSGLSAELGRLVPDVFPSPSAQRSLTGRRRIGFGSSTRWPGCYASCAGSMRWRWCSMTCTGRTRHR